MFDFLFSSGRPWFKPQNEVGNRGLIKQIRAMDDSLNEGPSLGRSDENEGRIGEEGGWHHDRLADCNDYFGKYCPATSLSSIIGRIWEILRHRTRIGEVCRSRMNLTCSIRLWTVAPATRKSPVQSGRVRELPSMEEGPVMER